MSRVGDLAARGWMRVGTAWLPFADAATPELPLPRLLRLGLFQVTVGMAAALLAGTLNRVMIVELRVSAGLVAAMLALPLVFAPLRALIGFRSDVHRSVLGWRRVPFLWTGTMLQFGGLAILPFSLILLTGERPDQRLAGILGGAVAFLLVGAGSHTVQTAGLALATDLAPERSRPRVVALLYLMLLAGMLLGSLAFGRLLADFSHTRLVQVVQGSAMVTVALNLLALWKQEPRGAVLPLPADAPRPGFLAAWRAFAGDRRAKRLLVGVGLGTAGFSMQDALLEPYGGQVLHLGVASTTLLTALMAAGAIAAFALSARVLSRGGDPARLAAWGMLAGVAGFTAVIFASPLGSAGVFRAGTACIGFGGGMFSVGTLTLAMSMDRRAGSGLAVGAWGSVQATCAGRALALGGLLRDAVAHVGATGVLGPGLSSPADAYGVVYQLELGLLFAALAVVGPLAAPRGQRAAAGSFGMAEMPG
ncbi:MAG TPA: BCD family MFS transporter [Longimicrobiaceae bacterium]|nr:BCD family MFS transporter [Longimicrobiaceae bacterium]